MGIGHDKKGQNAGVMRIPETKKPPLGGYDITTYCFDYSVFLFPGTRGGT